MPEPNHSVGGSTACDGPSANSSSTIIGSAITKVSAMSCSMRRRRWRSAAAGSTVVSVSEGSSIITLVRRDSLGRQRERRSPLVGHFYEAAEKVAIRATGSVIGDIVSPRLAIEDGGRLHGQVETPSSPKATAAVLRNTA